MSLKRAFVLSLLIHLAVLYFLANTWLFFPETRGVNRGLIARLVEPEQPKKHSSELKGPSQLTSPHKSKGKIKKRAPVEKKGPAKNKTTKPKSASAPVTKPSEITRDIKKQSQPLMSKKAEPQAGFTKSGKTGKQPVEKPSLQTLQGKSEAGKTSKKGSTVRIPTGKELLDKEIIGGIAKNFIKKQPLRKQGGITFSTKDLRYYSYMMRLKERIESIWVYPPEAVRRGIYGDLWILFTIKRDGSLGEVKLLRTSGYPELDEAAMRALREGAPYWPLPEKWKEDAITIKGHFVYSLYGMYIR